MSSLENPMSRERIGFDSPRPRRVSLRLLAARRSLIRDAALAQHAGQRKWHLQPAGTSAKAEGAFCA